MQYIQKINGQSGWTIWSIMFYTLFAFAIVFLGTKLVPIFNTNENIKRAMQNTMHEVTQAKFKPSTVRNKLDTLLYADHDHQVLDYKKDVKLKIVKGKMVLQVQYEREIELPMGFRLVKAFDNNVEKAIK